MFSPYLLKPFVLVFSFMLLSTLFAGNQDTVVLNMQNYNVYQVDGKQEFYIKNKTGQITVKHLKYYAQLNGYLQALDTKNIPLFIDADGLKSDEIHPFYGVCGTVPHYELAIKDSANTFIVTEDETFYDSEGIPPVAIQTISKKQADGVYFVNGQNQFNFTSNYGYGRFWWPDPRTIYYKSGGKYYFLKDSDHAAYDQVEYDMGRLLVKQNNLIGIYGFLPVKYVDLGAFNYRLARFELPDGRTGYVDDTGKEYFD